MARVTPSAVGACAFSARRSRSATSAVRSASSPRSSGQVGGHRHDGVQRLPAVADGPGAARRGIGVPHAGQHGAHLVDQITGVVLTAPRGTAEQRDRLPDLRPVEEALDTAQRERDVVLTERLLERLGLRVDAEQHGHLAIGHAATMEQRDLVGDGVGLRRLVGVPEVGDRIARLGLGLQPHACGVGTTAVEHGVRDRHDLRCGAVVADELDAFRVREAAAEGREDLRRGPGEGVDGLPRVADDADLVAAAEPEVEQRRLQRVDVLELVDDEPAVLPAHLGGDPLVVGEDGRGDEQDVLHVDAAALALDVLVGRHQRPDGGGVEVGHLATRLGRRGDVVGRTDVADLGPLDLGGEVAQERGVGAEAEATDGLGDQPELGLHDLGEHRAVDLRPEVPGLAERSGVERAGLDAGGAEGTEPPAHLTGCTGGEGDRQHLLRLVDAGGHAVRDAVRDGAGLAGAGTRDDAHRPAQRRGDLALLGIEGVEQVIGGGHGPPREIAGIVRWLNMKPVGPSRLGWSRLIVGGDTRCTVRSRCTRLHGAATATA